MSEQSTDAPRGCSFLTGSVGSEEIKTPEKFTEEQRMFAATVQDFMDEEVFPAVDQLEEKDFDKMVELLREAAELGLLKIDIPEEYGGLQVDKTTSMIVSEIVSQYASFSVTYGAQTGIGMLPILYFGTPEQKEKWLPKIGNGELIAAYALTEPGSGSDALAAKTRAEPVDGGDRFVINGIDRGRRTQDGPTRLVDSAGQFRRRRGSRRERHRRDRQRTQDRLQHPKHRSIQAGSWFAR